ncbi:cytochrome c oxidase accessory protein CcoG [Pseudomonas sp. 5P_3.1_Bac2]|uniref:cytochrome c oxidase accessory protein CcoG n=1 Tax=Pseudomonas sp. 5P_3.1_Bac2 TaxID=2971617 RepID=UPI0021CA75A8|nr:cytochrome c oxidase accessory protein CcoG [Pseudomonas sp. 5P_3.1_Bac2]MCU1716984.1 cytochrome c oxidase accessory protein CcoG [Pseudomonas sp. 5P_3.1_Bac2]
MTERIPATLVETIDPQKPIRLTPAQAGGPIHTRSFTGLFRNLRLYGAGSLFVLFFGTVWLNWGERQAVLWDFGQSQFHIFGATFWPQDFILLSALLIICAFGLFFITKFAGRVWCGYSCPHSLWTWIFMWAEKVTEGDRNQRIKLDAAPWSANKLLRRSAKHAIWLAVSLATALTFVGYFTPIKQLVPDLLHWQAGATTSFWIFLFSAATYINGGFVREKVCLHMCPYSRFQSVMFDDSTLLVSYDSQRGEGRGSRKKDSDYRAEGLGDCIDCTLCVQVCPTGIDIRDGLQLDCISCGACIDACDSVMDKMGYARGLVRYSSERAMAGTPTRWLRPQLVGYAAMLLVMIGALVWALEERSLVSLDVHKDRSLFRENNQGQVENIYVLKVINKTMQPHSYHLSLRSEADLRLQGQQQLHLAPGEMLEVPVSVALLSGHSNRTSQPLSFELVEQSDPSIQVSAASTFVAPVNR